MARVLLTGANGHVGSNNDIHRKTVPLEKMLDKYYRLRGYDANGIPTVDTLKKLGIQY